MTCMNHRAATGAGMIGGHAWPRPVRATVSDVNPPVPPNPGVARINLDVRTIPLRPPQAGSPARCGRTPRTVTGFDFPPPEMPPGTDALRAEVRAFLAESQAAEGWQPNSDFGSEWSTSFSGSLGARGWIGMTWPERYGGHARSDLERYVVIEELLAAGAPVYAHWVADRQSGPLLLRFGSEAQRQAILPRIAAGECYFAIGMSEPNSGSDLASVRTRAERTDGRLAHRRHQGVDQQRPSLPLHDRALPHGAGRRQPSRGSQPVPDRPRSRRGAGQSRSSTSPASTTSTSASSRTWSFPPTG